MKGFVCVCQCGSWKNEGNKMNEKDSERLRVRELEAVGRLVEYYTHSTINWTFFLL